MANANRTHPLAASGGDAAYLVPPSAAGLGVRCPDCGCQGLEVLQTRRARDGRILRRRRCRQCGRRISTSEHLL